MSPELGTVGDAVDMGNFRAFPNDHCDAGWHRAVGEATVGHYAVCGSLFDLGEDAAELGLVNVGATFGPDDVMGTGDLLVYRKL